MRRILSFQRWRSHLALAVPLAALLHAGQAGAVEAPELKAAIVYNILQFVEWPPEAEHPRGLVTLCVDGGGHLAAHFKSLSGRPVQKRLLDVSELAEPVAGADSFRHCHAVFLDATSRRAGALASRLPRSAPLLVVGDLGDGVPEAMVQLVEAGGRMGFNVDLAWARRSKLQVSSRLLKLAKKVSE